MSFAQGNVTKLGFIKTTSPDEIILLIPPRASIEFRVIAFRSSPFIIATFDLVPVNEGSSSFLDLKHEKANAELMASVEKMPVLRKSLLLNDDMIVTFGSLKYATAKKVTTCV